MASISLPHKFRLEAFELTVPAFADLEVSNSSSSRLVLMSKKGSAEYWRLNPNKKILKIDVWIVRYLGAQVDEWPKTFEKPLLESLKAAD